MFFKVLWLFVLLRISPFVTFCWTSSSSSSFPLWTVQRWVVSLSCLFLKIKNLPILLCRGINSPLSHNWPCPKACISTTEMTLQTFFLIKDTLLLRTALPYLNLFLPPTSQPSPEVLTTLEHTPHSLTDWVR